jgi:hypothetical protein
MRATCDVNFINKALIFVMVSGAQYNYEALENTVFCSVLSLRIS